jgi:RNA polymerase sigma-70 factor (ECF subfamily)
MTKNIEDARELIERAIAGDREAFDAFVLNCQWWFDDQIEKVLTEHHGYSLGIDPKEVLNELLIHLWSYWTKRHPPLPDNLPAYFARAVRNQCYMALRKAGKEQERTIPLEDWNELVSGEGLSLSQLNYLRKQVQEAMSHLSKQERDVLLLRCDERLSWQDIAQRLGLTTRQVKYLYCKAAAKFRKALPR